MCEDVVRIVAIVFSNWESDDGCNNKDHIHHNEDALEFAHCFGECRG